MPVKIARKKKAETRLSYEGEKSKLAYLDLAKRVAAGKATKLAHGTIGMKAHVYTPGEGSALKQSMLSMAQDRVIVDKETLRKLDAMDPDKLQQFYHNNRTAFEVYFNYEGIKGGKDGKPYIIEQSKKDDITWFIGQYEKIYGRL